MLSSIVSSLRLISLIIPIPFHLRGLLAAFISLSILLVCISRNPAYPSRSPEEHTAARARKLNTQIEKSRLVAAARAMRLNIRIEDLRQVAAAQAKNLRAEAAQMGFDALSKEYQAARLEEMHKGYVRHEVETGRVFGLAKVGCGRE